MTRFVELARVLHAELLDLVNHTDAGAGEPIPTSISFDFNPARDAGVRAALSRLSEIADARADLASPTDHAAARLVDAAQAAIDATVATCRRGDAKWVATWTALGDAIAHAEFLTVAAPRVKAPEPCAASKPGATSDRGTIQTGTLAHAGLEPRYAVTRQQGTWEIVFDGRKYSGIPDLKGMPVLVKLLSSKDSLPIPALELARDESCAMPTAEAATGGVDDHQQRHLDDPLIDEEALKRYHEALIDIDAQIDVAERNHDDAAKGRLLTERGQIEGQMRKDTRRTSGGTRRGVFRGGKENAYQSVKSRIKGIKDRIQKDSPLRAHLDRCIKGGGYGFAYTPGEPRPMWIFSL